MITYEQLYLEEKKDDSIGWTLTNAINLRHAVMLFSLLFPSCRLRFLMA